MENYELTKAARLFGDFVINDISNWYIRRNRRRFWKSGESIDKLSAYQTLHELLITIAKIVAPYIPLIAEEIYTNLKGTNDPESVHLCNYPMVTEKQKSNRFCKPWQKPLLARQIIQPPQKTNRS